MTKTFNWSKCKMCNLHYQPCTWLKCRTIGFCSDRCNDLYEMNGFVFNYK